MLHHALLEQEEEEKGLTGLASRRSHNFHTFRAVSLELSPPAAVGPWQELPALLVAMLMSAINAVSYGSLLFAWPRPSGTVVWLLSSIGTQLGTLMASNISNGISCPMMEMPLSKDLGLKAHVYLHPSLPIATLGGRQPAFSMDVAWIYVVFSWILTEIMAFGRVDRGVELLKCSLLMALEPRIPIFHAMFVQIGLRMPEAAEEEVRATCLAAAFVCTLSREDAITCYYMLYKLLYDHYMLYVGFIDIHMI